MSKMSDMKAAWTTTLSWIRPGISRGPKDSGRDPEIGCSFCYSLSESDLADVLCIRAYLVKSIKRAEFCGGPSHANRSGDILGWI
jgi:hypothetical protein